MNGIDSTPQTYPSIRQSWSILGVVILMALACSPMIGLSPWIGAEAAMFVYYVSAFGLSFYVVHSIRKRRLGRSPYDIRIGSSRLILPLFLGSVTLLFGVAAPLAGLIPMPEQGEKAMRSLGSQTGPFTLLYFVLAAPILEELIFRGVMLDGLLRRYKPLTAVLVSSLLFGLAHLNPWQFVTGFVLGCFLGWVYFRTGSVVACIVIHMSANFSGYLMRFLIDFEANGGGQGGANESPGGRVLLLAAALAVFCAHRQLVKARVRRPSLRRGRSRHASANRCRTGELRRISSVSSNV